MGNGAGRNKTSYLNNVNHFPFQNGRPDFIQNQPHPDQIQPNQDQNQSSVPKYLKPIINGPRHNRLGKDIL